MKLQLISMGLALTATSTQAATKFFEIKDRHYGNAANIAGAQAYIDRTFDELENQVNSNLPEIEPDLYVKGIAGASKLSTSGIGWDHNTPFTLFSVGVGAAVGADLAGNKISDLIQGDVDFNKLPGVAAGATVSLGVNPGSIVKGPWLWGKVDPNRLRLWINFAHGGFTRDTLHASTTSWGLHATYKLLTERSTLARSVKWNGVSVGTGIDHASTEMSIAQHISPDPVVERATDLPLSPSITGTFDGDVTVGGNIGITTIPIEVSTGARLFYVFGLFGGLGMDMNFGSSKALADIQSDIAVTDSVGAFGDVGGTGSINLDGSASPQFFGLRGFLGVEIELGAANITVQVNKAFTGGQLGATLGARLFW